MTNSKSKKAIVLLSGGLDSILATKMVLDQGIDVTALNFMTVFCTCTSKGCQHAATKASEELKVPLKIMNITEEYLSIVKNPKHGYGSNMNPCIDCRIFIFRKTKEYMKEIGASFIITGEVLGERPMSQRRDAIMLIEKEAGLKGLILRPLSAKLFEPTIAETEGIVDREKLLAISGRSRKPQIALADELDIHDYPCPAGGCLLTDPGFAKRIRDLIGHDLLNIDNVRTLKFGRHFRLSQDAKLIVGREEAENNAIQSLAMAGDICFKLKDRQGPFSLLRGKSDDDLIRRAAEIAAFHTKFRNETSIEVNYWRHGSDGITTMSVRPASDTVVEEVRV